MLVLVIEDESFRSQMIKAIRHNLDYQNQFRTMTVGQSNIVPHVDYYPDKKDS